MKVNLFSSKNRFRAGTRAKNIRSKRRAIRKHQGPIGSKKKKALIIKKIIIIKKKKKDILHQLAHNSRSRSQKLADSRDVEVNFYLCSVTFELHYDRLRLITRLVSPLLIF